MRLRAVCVSRVCAFTMIFVNSFIDNFMEGHVIIIITTFGTNSVKHTCNLILEQTDTTSEIIVHLVKLK